MSKLTQYEILESISQGENGALSPENAHLANVANDLRRAVECSRTDETEYGERHRDGAWLSEIEKRW